MTIKILWFTLPRPLEPLPSQIKELQRLFPHSQLIINDEPLRDAQGIIRVYEERRGDVMICVVPTPVLSLLLKKGYHPICPFMQPLAEDDPKSEYVQEGKGFRFIRFREVESIVTKFKELQDPEEFLHRCKRGKK